VAVLVSEQRPDRVLELADRVLFLEDGRIALDAAHDDAIRWLARRRPAWVALPETPGGERRTCADVLCRLEHVSFSYDGARPVVTDASLELRRGEVVALEGPNGSGKTTLAKLATGLLQPQTGRVDRHGRAAYLSQDPGRYVVCERADEEVALGAGGDRRRARAALERVGLAPFAGRHPRDLSSGERERLGLAAVLVTEPDLLVLDEPTRGVDPERKAALVDLLRADARGRATLVVTHDEHFAAAVADRRIRLGAQREVALV
jgi:energy-coupling factor transport system ATP-binding protein